MPLSQASRVAQPLPLELLQNLTSGIYSSRQSQVFPKINGQVFWMKTVIFYGPKLQTWYLCSVNFHWDPLDKVLINTTLFTPVICE